MFILAERRTVQKSDEMSPLMAAHDDSYVDMIVLFATLNMRDHVFMNSGPMVRGEGILVGSRMRAIGVAMIHHRVPSQAYEADADRNLESADEPHGKPPALPARNSGKPTVSDDELNRAYPANLRSRGRSVDRKK
jgi:hypothetical protein